ncbi:MAG: alpha/beta hydrolase [Candidatus Aenigmarchaeota archaeon]|nr:alpha/beta hydrolase [Candidatus Aenigmarchaeota archaeon]
MKEITFKRNGEDLFGTLYGNSLLAGVVLCPPHPLRGGWRGDDRLVSIANELANCNISALCIDYKQYTGGKEEVQDVLAAIGYMGKRVAGLGLLGYSYGSCVASNAASLSPVEIKGLVLLSPIKRINNLEIDVSSAYPKLLIYGKYDDFVVPSFEELYSKTKGKKEKLVLDTDHFYVGRGIMEQVSKKVGEFFSELFFK